MTQRVATPVSSIFNDHPQAAEQNHESFGWNFAYDQKMRREKKKLNKAPERAGNYVPIPNHAYDCHTAKGKKMGRTKADFFKAVQIALGTLQSGLFDDLIDCL